jgi:hypothetical protein
MYVKNNLDEAYRHAKANANSSGAPWMIFTDTSGNLRIERWIVGDRIKGTLVYPDDETELD